MKSSVRSRERWWGAVGTIAALAVLPALLFAREPYKEYIVTVPDGVALGDVPLDRTQQARLLSPLRSDILVTLQKKDESRYRNELERRVPGSALQPNFRYRAQMVPNDPSYALQWHLGTINMPDAWEFDTVDPRYGGSPSVIVAVLDTGVSYEQYQTYAKAPDFAATNFVQGIDLVNTDDHPNDDNGHGTHVAMTVAESTNNGLAGSGVAFNTSLMPVKVLDGSGNGSTGTIAAGIEYARTHGAHIINLSLGGIDNDPAVHTAIQQATAAGLLVVSATGNSSLDSIYYPARYDEVIAVGATRYDNARAPYANIGDGIDLVAPGGDLDVDQNGDGQSDGIIQQTCTTTACAAFDDFFYEGTSQAVPQVSAAAALLLAAGIPASQVTGLLEGSAKDLGVAGYDTTFGWGLLDVQRALYVGLNDSTPPSGSVTVNSGAAYVQGHAVTLAITAADSGTGMSSMSLSNNGSTYSPWETYSTVKQWDLTSYGGNTNDGGKTVSVRFRDAAGNVSAPVSSSITVDTVKPPKPVISAVAPIPNDRVRLVSGVPTAVNSFTATWSAPSDQSGISGYRVGYSTESGGALGDSGLVSERSFSAPTASHAMTKFLRIVAHDNAGNISEESVFTYTYRPLRIVTAAQSGAGLVTTATPQGKILKKWYPYSSSYTDGLSVASGAFGEARSRSIAVASLHAVKPIRLYTVDGVKVREFTAYGKKKVQGLQLATGDTNGDGIDELIVSPSTGTFPTLIMTSEGKTVKEFYPYGKSYRGGSTAAVFRYQGKTYLAVAKQSNDPTVTLFSVDGVKKSSFSAFPQKTNVSLSLAVGDINGDGNDEIVVAPRNGAPQVRVFDGKKKLIAQFFALSKNFTGGLSVAAGDTDGDGKASILTVPAHGGAHVGIFDQRGKNAVRFFSMSKTFTGGSSVIGAL